MLTLSTLLQSWNENLKDFQKKKIKPSITANHSFCLKPILTNNSKIRIRFKVSCLKHATFTPRNVVNLFFVYELYASLRNLKADFTLEGCLFGAVKLTKTADS